MGSTIQIFIALLALIVNTFVMIIMAFVSNIVIGPIMTVMSQFVTGPQAVPMSDMTWVIQSIWIILICMEIVCIISFLAVAARSNEVAYDVGY